MFIEYRGSDGVASICDVIAEGDHYINYKLTVRKNYGNAITSFHETVTEAIMHCYQDYGVEFDVDCTPLTDYFKDNPDGWEEFEEKIDTLQTVWVSYLTAGLAGEGRFLQKTLFDVFEKNVSETVKKYKGIPSVFSAVAIISSEIACAEAMAEENE